MELLGEPVIHAFQLKHPAARAPLDRWASIIRLSSFRGPADLKRAFPAADFVGNRTVFNVGGNKYRLIAAVLYSLQTLRVLHVLTHEEYDRGRWKD